MNELNEKQIAIIDNFIATNKNEIGTMTMNIFSQIVYDFILNEDENPRTKFAHISVSETLYLKIKELRKYLGLPKSKIL